MHSTCVLITDAQAISEMVMKTTGNQWKVSEKHLPSLLIPTYGVVQMIALIVLDRTFN